MRSAYRMFQIVGVMVKGKYCCERLISKAMDAVYPPVYMMPISHNPKSLFWNNAAIHCD